MDETKPDLESLRREALMCFAAHVDMRVHPATLLWLIEKATSPEVPAKFERPKVKRV